MPPLPIASRVREPMGVLKIKVWVSPLAILLWRCTPIIDIDGEQYDTPWGLHTFDVTPERHLIRIWFPYVTMPMCGLNEIKVALRPNETKRLQYTMPPIMFMKGQLLEVNRFTV